jgi:hypothetical protein
MKMMITCKQLNDIASDFLDGEVSLRQRLAIWLHRSMCRDCSRYIFQLKLSTKAVQKLTDQAQPSEGEIDQLLGEIMK